MSSSAAAAVVPQHLGDYLILETLGKGSFGKVKRGLHKPTSMPVAIKILNRQKLHKANMDKKIRREIKILSLFRHPNICRLYEVIQTPADIFLIMEYIDGGELYDYIVHQGKLNEAAARYVFQQIVCALEYCHHFRVVHRDLKPENILLGANLQVKIIDFGLANLMRDGDFLATSCGSPNYAAPEVISGRLYFGPEVDVWSCGVVLYALLCGCLPFDEDTIPQLFAKIKKGKYSVPSFITAGARALLEQVICVDPLVRLTIPQIRDNAWFNFGLPAHLAYNEQAFREKDRISTTVVKQVVEKCSCRDMDVWEQLEDGFGPLFVAYNILCDAKRRQEIATFGAKFQGAAPDTPVAQPLITASQRELNLGLVLSINPAMESLLDTGEASINKRAYNTASFLPASLHEQRGASAERTPISTPLGAFSIARPGSGNSLPSSASVSRSLRGGGTSVGIMASATASSFSDKPRVGSVARTQMVYSRDDEAFMIQNSCGWRVGLMSDQKSAICMLNIYEVLRSMGMEWKSPAQFRILARFIDRRGDVVLSLHLFRIQEKHDKGFVVDCGVVRGNALFALDAVLELSTKLCEKIG
jgi:5'-AMP-activated protein kinase catalytic alpha subunit